MIQSVRVKNIAEALKCLQNYVAKREEKGESTLVFSEDRLTLLVERAICEELGGSMLTDVATFSRYLKRTGDKILSKQGSVMKIAEIMLAEKENLKCFNKEYSARTAAKSVYETIAQFAACNITPELLENASFGDRALDIKIFDLAVVDRAYRSFLSGEGYLDENSMLALLPSAIRADKRLRHTGVVFFAFGSFTAQAAEGLRAALDCAKDALGIFMGGEEEFYTLEGESTFLSVASAFGGAKSYVFPSIYNDTRKKLSRSLFDPSVFREEPLFSEDIFIAECSDVAEEASFAASVVKKHILSGARYRDISVFVPDVQKYYREIAKTFAEYKIPCFADVKKSLVRHPLSEFILSVFRAVRERFSPDSVNDVLTNVFFGGCGEYANYLFKFASYRGGALKPLKDEDTLALYGYDKEALSASRSKFLEIVGRIKPFDTGEGFCLAVREILKSLGADALLEELEGEYDDVAIKSYLSQIDGTMDRILSEITAVSGKRRFSAGEFYDILSDGFTAAEISLIPIKSDAVFIGDISLSKVNDGKVVVALGLTDAVPCYSHDAALISDRDIIRLKNKNIDVAPLISQVNLRARESAALNLLSFTEKLYLSYPVSFDGKETSRSEILSYVRRAFVTKKGNLKAERPDLFPYCASEFIPAQKKMYSERDLLKGNRKKDGRQFSALACLLEKEGVCVEKKENADCIPLGGKLFTGTDGSRALSPTLLESFQTCPYRNFAERGLGLKEKEEGIMKATDSGTFMHEILRGVGERVRDKKISDLASCLSAAEEVGREILSRPEYRAMADNPTDRYYAERLISDGKKISGEMYERLASGGFDIDEIEKNCYIECLHVRGKIDRVDKKEDFIRVVDYKTGSIEAGVNEYYMGTKLQLELYANAVVERAKEKKIAGLFYFPARVDFSRAEDDEDPFGLKGFVSDEGEIVSAMEGILHKRTKRVSSGGFRSFLRYAEKMAQYGKRMIERGYIRPAPCDEACRYCKFKGLCGFDGEDRTSSFSALKTEDIIEIVRILEEENEHV